MSMMDQTEGTNGGETPDGDWSPIRQRVDDIQTAARVGSLSDVEIFVKADPGCVNAAGWHGMTALHYACLAGHLPIIRLLVENGTNINQPNNAGEVPLHMACQTGQFRVLMFVLGAGADLTIRDVRGRSAIVHAAARGHTHIVHYLHECLHQPYTETDSMGHTLLHMAADSNHVWLVRYLLRKRRVDPLLTDSLGRSALHVAAQHCYTETCRVLVRSTLSLLPLKDSEGLTALDTAQRQSATTKGEQKDKTVAFLLAAKAATTTNDIPTATQLSVFEKKVLMWSAPAFVLVAVVSFCKYRFWQLLLTICLVTYLTRRYFLPLYRERGPNPFPPCLFVSLWCLYAACYAAVLVSGSKQHAISIAADTLMLVAVLMTYYLLCMGDPGVVNKNPNKGIKDVAVEGLGESAFCPTCEIVRPPHTRHCADCDVCVRHFDHHCGWLNKDVAGENHRIFVGFLALSLMAELAFITNCISYLSDQSSLSTGLLDTLVTSYVNSPIVLLCGVSILLPMAFEAHMLYLQTKQITLGQTTYDVITSARSGSSQKKEVSWAVVFDRWGTFLGVRAPDSPDSNV